MNKQDIIRYLESDDTKTLFAKADECRRQFCGDQVHIRGVIEFSNYCQRDCLYCGLRKSNTKLKRYRLNIEEIFAIVTQAGKLGYQTIILQSGESNVYKIDELCRLVERIKKEVGCVITLSLGEKTYKEYKRLKEAGVDRYLLKFETSDRLLYNKLRPDAVYQERLQCLYWLKGLGYQTGSGNMIGLPGQSIESVAEDVLLMKELNLDMIGIGPFIPHPNTPLGNRGAGKLKEVLKTIALTRIVTKNAHIPATTAVGTINPQARQKALQSGANVIMANVTPQQYRQHYQIYPNRICVNDQPGDCRRCIEAMVTSLGRTIAKGYGHSFKT